MSRFSMTLMMILSVWWASSSQALSACRSISSRRRRRSACRDGVCPTRTRNLTSRMTRCPRRTIRQTTRIRCWTNRRCRWMNLHRLRRHRCQMNPTRRYLIRSFYEHDGSVPFRAVSLWRAGARVPVALSLSHAGVPSPFLVRVRAHDVLARVSFLAAFLLRVSTKKRWNIN